MSQSLFQAERLRGLQLFTPGLQIAALLRRCGKGMNGKSLQRQVISTLSSAPWLGVEFLFVIRS